ncbi:MAG: DUF4298 domain-containing protein [Peptoniphilus sp.]|nr:DUF4298 domain-containing protein [Peptoniphilus sp.]
MDLNRIEKMEKILDDHGVVVNEFRKSLTKFMDSQRDYQELKKYYLSEEYIEDVEASNSPNFPKNIKCGVLSQDAVFDLIGENYDMAIRMLEAATELIKNH